MRFGQEQWTMKVIVIGIVVVFLVVARGESQCGKSEMKCLCGVPRCIDLKLVNNGVQDCQDGSDEQGQWDLRKCSEAQSTSWPRREKRGAISELLRVTNGGATTTFFEGERGRTKPTGILTTTMGSFQVSGTTTEYITKLIATYIKGTYARILSTTSRIYNAAPTMLGGSMPEISPTGMITSTVSTEVNGYATTVHTTEFYRTYIDNTYVQQMSSYSNVHYPPWYTDSIESTVQATPTESEEASATIYPTPVYIPIDDLMTLDSTPPVIQHEANGRFGRILVNGFPVRVDGQFEESPRKEVAPLAIFVAPPNTAPLSVKLNENEVRVTGTHGNFVANGDRTYNVFTGSYVQNSQTFLFFFGNSAINPSSPTEAAQQTILVENGKQRDHLVVDMKDQLKLIVPGAKERTTIDTTLDGQAVEGVMVEIEGSENIAEDLIMVEGARPTEAPTPHDPRIATVTVTLDKNIAGPKVPRDVNLRPVLPTEEEVTDDETLRLGFLAENEIPTGRSASPRPILPLMGTPKAEEQIQPSKVNFETQILPTYTVGLEGNDSPKNYYEATTNSAEDLTPMNPESTTATSKVEQAKPRQPVFQKGQKTFTPGKSINSNPFSRKAKTFSDLRDLGTTGGSGWGGESNDLIMAAASHRHATVTYVGFADFTTTVGNTVIVFMPRTRMLEDFGQHVTPTQSVHVDPTRYTYHTTTEEEIPVTTPKRIEPVTEPDLIEFTTPKLSPVIIRPKFPRKKLESSTFTSASQPETTVLISGKQTLFNQLKFTPKFSAQPVSEVSKPFLVSPTFDLSIVTTPHPNAKSLEEPTTVQRLETTVFQKDRTNPTGLVSSIVGSLVRDSTTTLITSLVIGTFIEGSYAQVIKSTSTVFFLPPPSPTVEPTAIFIRPTPVPVLSSTFPSMTTKSPVYSYTFEVTTSSPEDEETTPSTFERAEVRVSSSTTEVVTTTNEAETEEPPTTIGNTTEEPTSTALPINIQKEDLDEALNEIERARKVAGKLQDQKIVDDKKIDTTLEKPVTEKVQVEEPTTTPPASEPPVPTESQSEDENTEVDQTIYITKTVPTTIFRTYTYFTTYFIPKEDKTLSSVISREVTSTAVGFIKKTFSSIQPTATGQSSPETTTLPTNFSDEEDEEDDIEPTFYKTYFTTFTYLTTFFTGETSSVSSREEVISSVSTITQMSPSGSADLAIPVKTTVSPLDSQKLFSKDKSTEKEKVVIVPSVQLPSVVEQTVLKTFFTTYTYFSTLFNGADASTRSRIEVITNVVPTVMRTTITSLPQGPHIEPSSRQESLQAQPTSAASHSVEDLSEGGSDVSETAQVSSHHEPTGNDYYELESSEMTTDHSIYNEQELEDDNGTEATPALKTLFTTFSFFTTYYKGGTSSVATRLQTITNLVSDGGVEGNKSTEAEQFPVFPITYLTTFTYWTTHFKGDSTVVTSREETISNVVTPGVNDLSSTPTSSVAVKPTDVPQPREPKMVDLEDGSEADESLELTTYFTTYTYFTSSYIGDETIVNSRLETVTNIVSDTPSLSSTLVSTSSHDLMKTATVELEVPETVPPKLPVGLLSTMTNREVVDETTTEYMTDVFGTYIDGVYAQVLESTSRVILPMNQAQTKFIIEATETPIGLVAINQGKTIEGDGRATTFYQTATIGTNINGTYAQIISSSSSIAGDSVAQTIGDAELQRTGLVRVIDGYLVQGEKTTFYTSSIYGTIIDNQYGQIIESTTRFVISPTESLVIPPAEPTLTSSEAPLVFSEKETSSTTEGPTEASPPLKRLPGLPGRGRERVRVPYTPPSSKSLTPLITPFVSRNRPSFTPRRKEPSAAVVISRDEVTPTVTATLAPTTSLTNRPRFRRPGPGSQGDTPAVIPVATVLPTPRLPSTNGRTRFHRPSVSSHTTPLPTATANSPLPRFSSKPSIAPLKVSSTSGRGLPTKFSLRHRPSLAPSRPSLAFVSTTSVQVTTTLPPPITEPEEDHEEEEIITTDPPPKTSTAATRFGNNRFRLNPKLNVLHLLSTTTTEKTTLAPRARKTFTRAPHPTRGLPLSSTTETVVEADDKEAPLQDQDRDSQSDLPVQTTTAPPAPPVGKPSLKNLLANRKLTSSNTRVSSPPSTPRQQNRPLTTTPSPTPKPTTRRAFAPRLRPQGFPSRGLVRGAPTTEKGSDTELEFDESKSIPGKLEIPGGAALLSDMFGVEDDEEPAVVGAGSELIETIQMSPYDSYSGRIDEHPSSRTSYHRLKRQVNYGARSRAQILRTNFKRGGRETMTTNSKFPILSSSDNDHHASSSDKHDEYEYYYDDDATPTPISTTTPKPKLTTNSRSATRFRGRISPSSSFSSSKPTPFTLLPPTTPRTSRPPTSNAALLNSRRTQSRYRPGPSSDLATTAPSSRTTSRYQSLRSQRLTTTTPKSRNRFVPAMRNRGGVPSNEEPIQYEKVTERPRVILTVTHFVPSETTIPVVNGKVTEFKTLLIPSPSVEVLSPYQYTHSIENGQEYRVLNSQVTSTPSMGFGGVVTKFIIKEVPTTTVTFTPTTIRGRKTSFSHVISTNYYTIDPTVSTIGLNMFTTNPGDPNQLTNLLLSQLLGSLNLAGLQQQNSQIPNGQPQTQYNTKTTSYVTTITDFTSTVIPITLHGKAIKTTIVESHVNVLTATELITESTIIPAQSTQVPPPPPPAISALSPALLELLQQQQQLNLQIQSTSMEQFQPALPAVTSTPTVVTLFVSGKSPGEFSTVLTTINTDGRKKRDITPTKSTWVEVLPTATVEINSLGQRPQVELEDGYSYSEGIWFPQSAMQDNYLTSRTQSLGRDE